MFGTNAAYTTRTV